MKSLVGRPVSYWQQFDLIEAIDEAAQAENMTRSAYVQRAIHESLQKRSQNVKKGSEQGK